MRKTKRVKRPKPTPEEQSFREACKQEGEAGRTASLVFSDWLEDQGRWHDALMVRHNARISQAFYFIRDSGIPLVPTRAIQCYRSLSAARGSISSDLGGWGWWSREHPRKTRQDYEEERKQKMLTQEIAVFEMRLQPLGVLAATAELEEERQTPQ